MKKVLISFLLLFVFVSGMAAASSLNGTFNGNAIVKVISGGKTLTDEVPAQIIDGKTMVPLTMLRNLGFNVTWNANDYSVEVKQKHELTNAEIAQIGRNVGIIYVYKDGKYLEQGSGFVINTVKYGKVMVSNCHVGCAGNELKITLDGKGYDFKGTPLFSNEQTDVYGFMINTDVPGLEYTTEFPIENDKVVAVGYPLEHYAATKGKYSSVVYEGEVKTLATDARIDKGSSGGLLSDNNGIAIGITSYSRSAGDIFISQAIPMKFIQDELDKIK